MTHFGDDSNSCVIHRIKRVLFTEAYCGGAGVPLVMASAEGPHAQLLHSMCQRRYWDTLEIRQYLARIDKTPRLRLEPSQGLRYALHQSSSCQSSSCQMAAVEH